MYNNKGNAPPYISYELQFPEKGRKTGRPFRSDRCKSAIGR